jgi:hypothetical protein
MGKFFSEAKLAAIKIFRCKRIGYVQEWNCGFDHSAPPRRIEILQELRR